MSTIEDEICVERMEHLNFPSLSDKRVSGDAIEMYKYTHDTCQVQSKHFTLHGDMSKRNRGYRLLKERCENSQRRKLFGKECIITGMLYQLKLLKHQVNTFKGRLDKYWKEYLFLIDTRTVQCKTSRCAELS